jgi:pyrimidine-specific ribonucleoside hydrolase
VSDPFSIRPVAPRAYDARMRRILTTGRVIAVGFLVTVAACGPSTGSPPPPQSDEPPTSRIPIIVDADFDQSDIAAILILLRDPAVEVRAITIAGTGLVHCQAGRLLTRFLIDELGSPDIPFGCGREDGGPDAHPFPDAWRLRADEAFGLNIPPQAEAGLPRGAVEVIAATVESGPSAPTIVALGPLTNLEDAFAADAAIADRVAGIHAMLGTVDAPGNVFVDGLDAGDPLEWNAYADPSAVAAVFASDVPISIVPLDATDDVPVPVDLADRLADDHQAGGADLMYESLIRNPGRMRPEDGQQLWDELAALTLSDPDLVAWEDAAVIVEVDGRLTRDDAGRIVRFAVSADRAAVETALLTALRRGEPRATPFRLAGSLSASFDGTICSLHGTSDETGLHVIEYQGIAGTPSGVAIAGTRPPYRWTQLVVLLPSFDPAAPPPEWVVEGPVADDPAGTGGLVTGAGDLDEGTYGPVCFTGTWPDLAYTAGIPFQAGAGAVGAAP